MTANTRILIKSEEGVSTKYFAQREIKFSYWWAWTGLCWLNGWWNINIYYYDTRYRSETLFSIDDAKKAIDLYLEGKDINPSLLDRVTTQIIKYP